MKYFVTGATGFVGGVLDALMSDSYTSEGLQAISGTTYTADNSKANRELGFNPRPVSEGWVETVKHEMSLLSK